MKRMSRVWDAFAVQSLRSGGRGSEAYSYYMTSLYERSIEIGLRDVKPQDINLLKVDLWNEGIAYKTNILRKYETNENYCLYGIDISRVVCLRAKSKVSRVQVVQATIENLPFRAGSFDMILDLSTSDHVSEDRALNALQEYGRTLVKDGVMVLVFSCMGIGTAMRRVSHKKRDDPRQPYFFSQRFVRNAKRLFNVLDERRVGTLLDFAAVFDRLPTHLRDSLLNSLLALELSKTSKVMLRVLGGLHIIIGARRD
jgi:SAM-dependent methyltransferase